MKLAAIQTCLGKLRNNMLTVYFREVGALAYKKLSYHRGLFSQPVGRAVCIVGGKWLIRKP